MSFRNRMAVWLLVMPAWAGGPVTLGLSIGEESDNLPVAVLSAMKAETGRILKPAGVQIRWSDTVDLSREAPNRLVLVRLVGVSSAGVALRGAEGVLAVTHMSDGRILPFVDMDVQRVARVIERFGVVGRAQEYGRALGRVLAHELYHVLSGSVEHDSEGVAKSALNGVELVRSELSLSEGACRRIREALGLMGTP
ncbi:MAG: hypothetical protein IH602_02670 [Bryobacteraceae bacterium]|nr:hypothetical protein [Bryobacteraceae bacterium]